MLVDSSSSNNNNSSSSSSSSSSGSSSCSSSSSSTGNANTSSNRYSESASIDFSRLFAKNPTALRDYYDEYKQSFDFKNPLAQLALTKAILGNVLCVPSFQ